MSHDTHGQPLENKTVISFKNSFWLVVIIVGLFIGALNFVQAMSSSEEGEGAEKTEMKDNSGAGSGNMEQKEGPKPATGSSDSSKAAVQ